ncbi:Fur-regulated basic protein FbpA [Thalassobacillus sp. C254]|nr:Fur-regulated basic protein FbpA [Thalassobacillus sp. C254]
MELRRQYLIDELEKQGFYESREGKPLRSLSLQEIECEYVRLPELKEIAE